MLQRASACIFLDTVCILLLHVMLLILSTEVLSAKWTVSAGSVGGVWFLPEGKKRTDSCASLSFLHTKLNCRNVIRLKWNKVPVAEVSLQVFLLLHFRVSPITYTVICILLLGVCLMWMKEPTAQLKLLLQVLGSNLIPAQVDGNELAAWVRWRLWHCWQLMSLTVVLGEWNMGERGIPFPGNSQYGLATANCCQTWKPLGQLDFVRLQVSIFLHWYWQTLKQ